MRIVVTLALAAIFGAAVWFAGWWTVPVVAGAYGLARRSRLAPREAMLAALVGTLALFVPVATRAAFPRLLTQLGSVFPVPGFVVLLLALLLAMLLAFTSARVAIGLVGVDERA